MTSVSGPVPIANLGLSAQGQAKLKELDQDGNGTLTRGELDKAIADRYASCSTEQAGLCVADPDGSSIAEAELRIQLGFSGEDAQKIAARVQAHSSDPTSPLVQFGEPSRSEAVPTDVTPTAVVPTEVIPTDPAPSEVAATATKPLENLTDSQALTSKPGMVLRGEPLKARLKELEDQSQKGIERLEARIKELGDKAPAEMKASLEKLKELKTLLASSDPKAVEKLQTFLTSNNGKRTGDQSFDKLLEYQANGKPKAIDNLYGKRTDACLRDLIMELGNQDAPAVAPVTDTPVQSDAPVAESDVAVRSDDVPPVQEDQPILTGAWNLGGFGLPTAPSSTSLNYGFTQPASLYSPSSVSSLSFGPRVNTGLTFASTNPTLSFGLPNTSFNSRFGLSPDFGYRPGMLSIPDYTSTNDLMRLNTVPAQ